MFRCQNEMCTVVAKSRINESELKMEKVMKWRIKTEKVHVLSSTQ